MINYRTTVLRYRIIAITMWYKLRLRRFGFIDSEKAAAFTHFSARLASFFAQMNMHSAFSRQNLRLHVMREWKALPEIDRRDRNRRREKQKGGGPLGLRM